jgi:hypothetical protein
VNEYIRLLWGAVAGLVALTAPLDKSATAAPFLNIDLYIVETNYFDGTVSYSLSAGYFTFRRDRLANLRTPSGATFPESWPLQIASRTWEEIEVELIGEWTFTSAPKESPGDVQEYRFTVAPLEPASLSPELPTLSPRNLSVVGSPFTVTSTAPNGNFGAAIDGIFDGRIDYIQNGEAKITFGRVISDDAYLTVTSTSDSELLSGVVSAATRPGDAAHYFVLPSLHFARRVEVRYFPAVPEPSAAVLVLAGSVALGGGMQTTLSRRLRRLHLSRVSRERVIRALRGFSDEVE